MKKPSAVRARLARRIEEAFLAQHGMDVTCDPKEIYFPRGYYRTNVHADTYRWTAYCTKSGTRAGPSVDSYDTATSCARFGILIDHMGYGRGYEATADTEAELLRDANSRYSSVQLEEMCR